jgi:transcriptional regulator with XRE-family HTH domain
VAKRTAALILRQVGAQVRRARTSRGLTQEEAAARAGIGYKRLQAIEAGSVNATIRTLARIADGLEYDFWRLLRGGPE